MANACCVGAITVTIVTVLTIGLILILCSYHNVELTEYGMVYSKNSQKIESDILPPGRYFLGLGRKLVTMPRGVITIEFSNTSTSHSNRMAAWTNDGLNVYLDVTIMITLNTNKMWGLYQEFGDTWLAALIRRAYTTIKETSTTFKTSDFFQKRYVVAAVMKEKILDGFNEFVPASVNVIGVQIREVDFDDDYDDAITAKLVQFQYKKIFEIQQSTSITQAETTLIQQRAANNISVIQAIAEANGTFYKENATAYAFSRQFTQMGTSYADIKNKLGLSSENDLIHFIYNTELQSAKATSKTYYGNFEPLVN